MKKTTIAVLLPLALLLFVMPSSAFANTTDAIARTGGNAVTVPILGTPVALDIVMDELGNLTGVNADTI